MDFSVKGLIIAAIIFAPNLLFVIFPPKNVPQGIKDTGFIFTILERIGQVACILLLILSKDYFDVVTINIWFVLMSLCITIYYCLWIRFIIKGRDFSLLFKPLGFIPIPMALFPVFAFGLVAISVKSIWIGIAVILLALGHFTNSWNTYKYTR